MLVLKSSYSSMDSVLFASFGKVYVGLLLRKEYGLLTLKSRLTGGSGVGVPDRQKHNYGY